MVYHLLIGDLSYPVTYLAKLLGLLMFRGKGSPYV